MLKFSGYPYLIRGQPQKGGSGRLPPRPRARVVLRLELDATATVFRAGRERAGPNTKQSLRVEMTLEQACPAEYHRAQCAFKDSMTH